MIRKAWVEALQYILIIAVLVVNIIGIVKIQTVINDNQAQTIAARQTNLQHQQEIKDYIKCIVLLRYDNPTLTVNSTRSETEVALDKCAMKE